MTTKRCTRCKQSKDIEEFGIGTRNRDGRQFWCKSCSAEYQRDRKAKLALCQRRNRLCKRCARCGQEKLLLDFGKDAGSLDGHRSWCFSCDRQYKREWIRNKRDEERRCDTSGVYMIRNKTNGKVYVGSSLDLKQRWIDHRKALRGNRHPNGRLQNSWNKYGEDAFEYVILEYVQEIDKLLDREQYWIDESKCQNDVYGYNILGQAENSYGYEHTADAKRKMSQAGHGKQSWLGKNHSDETKQKLSTEHLGKRNGWPKLTEMDVAEMRRQRAGGKRVRDIAKEFHVYIKAARAIVRLDTWQHVPIDEDTKRKLIAMRAVKDGALNPNAKLTEQMVREIRQKASDGEPLSSLAVEYGISHSSAWEIVTYRAWRNTE